MLKKANICKKIALLVAVIVFACTFFSNKSRASEGDIWLTPINQNVGTSASFDVEVHMDTGGNELGGFNLYFDFDSSSVTIDTTQGTSGVDKGSDASNYTIVTNADNISNGHLRMAGIAASGYANGNDVHIATIHAQTTSSFTSGTATLSLRVNELVDELSVALQSGTITGATATYPVSDTTAPTLAEVSAITSPTSDSTPSYTFSSTEAGTITYGGSCSSSTTQASIGNNTIIFSSLSDGTYSDCTIIVTDASSNASDALSVSTFIVDTSIPDTTAPSLSSGSPSGILSADTTQVTLSVNANENATCRYSTSANAHYNSMSGKFSTTGGTSQQATVDNLIAGNTYNFYVKCSDGNGNRNATDYVITFSIKSTDNASSSEDADATDADTTVIASSADTVDVNSVKIKTANNKVSIKLSGKKKVYSRETKVKFKGSVDGLSGGKVQIYVDKKLKYTFNIDSDGRWDKKIKLKDGKNHTVKFKYLDGSDNVVKESSRYTVKVDTKKPKFKKMPSFLVKHRGDKIWWKATDNNKVKYYRYYFNGKKKKTKRGSFIVPANMPRGLHTLKIKAYDKAGNKAIKYVVINVR